MFAVVKTGGKQYKVAKNDVIKIEKLSKTTPAVAGEVVLLDEVLAFNDGKTTKIGAPVVKGVAVSAEVIEQKKDKKVLIFKKKRRHNYRRKIGYRHTSVYLRIQDIGEGLKAKPAAKTAEPKAETKDAKPAAKTAAKTEAPKTEAKKAPAKKPAAKKAAPKAEDK
jgi:large subunit ribosomal protein L21